MKIVSAEEMRQIDELAQSRYGYGSFDLMAEAGRAVAETIAEAYRPENVCVVCGKGNNGGDGFVVARVLHEMGLTVSVVCLESESSLSGPARTAWDLLCVTNVSRGGREGLAEKLRQADVVVDALLGTGTRGPVVGNYADVIREMNLSGKVIVAVDVPSGLRDLQPGEDAGEIVCAVMTLTVGLPKVCLLTLPGADFAGRVVVLTINFPAELLESEQWMLNWAPREEMAGWLPVRKPDSNKGTYGSVGIIGGAATYAGATVLVARAALRAGCGLATIYTLPAANIIYKISLPEATSILLESGSAEYFDEAAATHFDLAKKDHTVLAMGPGLGNAAESREFVRQVLHGWTGPVVLDADALNFISEGMLDLLEGRENCLLTPHPGEMARLTGLAVKDVQADRLGVVRSFAVKHHVHVLLKGAGTLIARPDGQTWLVPGAEPALAKGGTGDVLTGAIASLFAQGVPMLQAAVLGASAHLAAGHQCSEKFGARGVLAGEVADAIPLILDAFQKNG